MNKDDKRIRLDAVSKTWGGQAAVDRISFDVAPGEFVILLELLGHRVNVAYDGQAALALATEERPEVLLLDIGMPGMDGYELARRLRRNPTMRDTVLAAITGYGLASDHAQALAAGFDRHFVKPVDIDQLVAFVNTA